MSIAISLSRILGLVRDQVMGFFFGATYLNDAFQIAVSIPNLLRRLFGEGALSAAFIPIYNKLGHEKGKKAQIEFALNMLSILTIFLLFLTIAGIALTPLIVKLISPGLPQNTAALAIKLCRITFPYLFFIGMSSTLIAILNSHNKFFMTGLSSGVYNIGIIGSVTLPFLLMKYSSDKLIFFAAAGIFIGGFLQVIINLPFLKKIGYNLKFNFSTSSANIKILWQKFLPGVVGIGVRQINLLVDIYIASFLPLGSITCLRYGARLMQMPLGIFGVSTGTAVLPTFSRLIAEEKWTELSEKVRFAMLTLIYLMIPATFFLFSTGEDIVRVLFQRGSFDSLATTTTYQSFIFYSFGLIFFALNQTIVPIYFANGDTKSPVIVSSIMVAINLGLNIVLLYFFQHIGIALATSLTGFIQFVILRIVLRKKLPQLKVSNLVGNIFKTLTISVVILGLTYGVNLFISGETLVSSLTRMAINSVIFLLVLVIGALVTKLEYSEIIFRKLKLTRFIK